MWAASHVWESHLQFGKIIYATCLQIKIEPLHIVMFIWKFIRWEAHMFRFQVFVWSQNAMLAALIFIPNSVLLESVHNGASVDYMFGSCEISLLVKQNHWVFLNTRLTVWPGIFCTCHHILHGITITNLVIILNNMIASIINIIIVEWSSPLPPKSNKIKYPFSTTQKST